MIMIHSTNQPINNLQTNLAPFSNAREGLSSTFKLEWHWELNCSNMADESEGATSLVAEKTTTNASSVPVSVEETSLEAKTATVGADVKLPPGVAPIRAQ